MPRSGKTRRVLSNDDGWLIGHAEYPLTPEKMWDDMVGPHVGTPIDGFLWSLGGHDVWDFETEIGERADRAYEGTDDSSAQNRSANLKYLIENHGGPITVIADLCQKAGMDFFPSYRMNEHYDMDESSPGFSRLRRENPHLLIGRGEELPQPSIEWGIRTGLDYAVAEVRSYMASMILETVERFDVAGVELDFMRHPAFFRIEEARANRYLITDLLHYVRRRMDEISNERNKPLDLIVRVPPTIADCHRIGLDVLAWIEEDLVDVVVAGGGFIAFEAPIREFVEAAEGTHTQIYGPLEALRPTVDRRVIRGAASRYWDAGVDGLYLFNYYSMAHEWKQDFLSGLLDREKLSRLDKVYETDDRSRFTGTSQLHFSFLNAIPTTQIPVGIDETLSDRGAVVRMEIPEEFDGARTRLSLLFENLGANDEVELSLNGTSLAWGDGDRSFDTWTREGYVDSWSSYPTKTETTIIPGEHVTFEIGSPPLARGINELEVRLVSPDPNRSGKLVLNKEAVSMSYR